MRPTFSSAVGEGGGRGKLWKRRLRGVGDGGRKAGREFIPHPLSSSQTQVLALPLFPSPPSGPPYSQKLWPSSRGTTRRERDERKKIFGSHLSYFSSILSSSLPVISFSSANLLCEAWAISRRSLVVSSSTSWSSFSRCWVLFKKDAKLRTRFPLLFFYRAEYEMPLTCAVSYSAPRLRRGGDIMSQDGGKGGERETPLRQPLFSRRKRKVTVRTTLRQEYRVCRV